ncbi:MAG: hypothetical protein ACYDDV_11820 [Methanoregula sp.]
MNDIHDDRVHTLYVLARRGEVAAVTDTQKMAIELLKDYSLQGNPDADAALNRLKHLPEIHPLLKEVLAA